MTEIIFEFIICHCVYMLQQPWKYVPQISKSNALRNRLTDCPSCHFWTHHCFRAVFLGCSQSVTSTVWILLHTFSAQHSMLGSFCSLVESFTELHCCLRLFPLYPSILFLLYCIKPPLTHCAWVPCATSVSPKTSIGICFLGPKLIQYIRHSKV